MQLKQTCCLARLKTNNFYKKSKTRLLTEVLRHNKVNYTLIIK